MRQARRLVGAAPDTTLAATRIGAGAPPWGAACVAATLAAAAAACVLLRGLGDTPLVDWDESIYAEVARSVRASGPLSLHWNGEPYWRKPPLLFWCIAAAYETFGVQEAAVRLPSAIAGIATVAAVTGLLVLRAGAMSSFVGAALLLASPLFVERGGRHAATDAFVILFSVLAIAAAGPVGATGSRRRAIAAGAFSGLAILSKGAAGLLAPLTILLAAAVQPARRRQAAVMWVTAFSVAAPWYAAQIVTGGWAFVRSHVGHELVARAVRPIHGTGAPWYYPIEQLYHGGGVWVPIVAAALLGVLVADRARRDTLLPWLVGVGLVLASATGMQTKLPWYPLPALALLAIAAGLLCAPHLGPPAPLARWARMAVLAAAVHSATNVPATRDAVLAQERDFEPFRAFGTTLAEMSLAGDVVGTIREHPSLVFYSGRAMATYDADDLVRLLRDPSVPPFLGLLPANRAEEIRAAGGEELGRLGDLLLFRLLPW